MRSIRTTSTRERFLDALRQSGNVTFSCLASGIARTAAYSWKNDDQHFSTEWEEALSLGLSALEDTTMEMARNGNEKLIMYLLSSRKPEVYGPRRSIDLRAASLMNLRGQSIDALRAELAGLLTAPSRVIETEIDDQSPNVIALLVGG